MADNNNSANQGFASMDNVEEIARKGGKATGGKNLTREARVKSGKNSRPNGRSS